MSTVFDADSFNIYEVLSINPSADVVVFADVNVHHKDRLVELEDLVNSVVILSDNYDYSDDYN